MAAAPVNTSTPKDTILDGLLNILPLLLLAHSNKHHCQQGAVAIHALRPAAANHICSVASASTSIGQNTVHVIHYCANTWSLLQLSFGTQVQCIFPGSRGPDTFTAMLAKTHGGQHVEEQPEAWTGLILLPLVHLCNQNCNASRLHAAYASTDQARELTEWGLRHQQNTGLDL